MDSQQGMVLQLGGLEEVLTNPPHKNWPCYKTDTCASDLD